MNFNTDRHLVVLVTASHSRLEKYHPEIVLKTVPREPAGKVLWASGKSGGMKVIPQKIPYHAKINRKLI